MIYNYFIFRKIKIIFSNFRNIHFKLYVFNNFIILKFYFNFLKNIYFLNFYLLNLRISIFIKQQFILFEWKIRNYKIHLILIPLQVYIITA